MKALTTQRQETYSMEEQWLWYLVGVYDTAGASRVKIRKDETFVTNYEFRPIISLSRPENKQVVFGMIDEYAEEYGVSYRIDENKGTTEVLVIDKPLSINNFLKPLMGGFVQQQNQSQIMFNKIIPAVLDDEHLTKPGFYELMGFVDELQETLATRKDPKYTQEYFKSEWNMG